MKIKNNISLKSYTTFKIGGKAKYFFVAKNEKDILNAIQWARKNKKAFFILGQGSNLLVADNGFDGLVIKMENDNLKILKKDKQTVELEAGAGMLLSDLIKYLEKKGFAGLEWLSGIPGTLGGTINGNAGAFGHCIAESIESVEIFDSKTKQIKKIKQKDCQFQYRQSIFKNNTKKIILSAILKFVLKDKKEIAKQIKEHLQYRQEHHLLIFPSIGCIFKNILVKEVDMGKLRKKIYPPKFLKKTWEGKIPAAFLIEQCGLKGFKIGGAKISKKHANFIVNYKQAKAEDVVKLISIIKEKVRNKFNLQLEEEITYLGFKIP